MITVTKEYTWDMAHLLEGHEGLCKNLHGHTYKMLVEVRSIQNLTETGPEAGMVIDFKRLKEVVAGLIVQPLDHCVMLNTQSEDPFEQGLIALVATFNKKAALVTYRPTAENMAKAFFKLLDAPLRQARVDLLSIVLYETPTSYATATRGY